MMKWILGLFAAISFTSSAIARDFPVQGGAGDRQDPEMCPKGSFVSGFKYRSGLWMDAIQLVCSAVKPDGTIGTRQPPLTERGGRGGAPADAYCPDNQIVHGIHFKLTINNQVKWINVFCADLSLKKFTDFKIGNDGPGATEQDSVIGQACGGDSYEAVRGITINTGRHVNALGVACRKKPISGCLIAGVMRKDIVDSDCQEAQNTGCIRHLLTDDQYANCLRAQKTQKTKPIKTTGKHSIDDRCQTHATFVVAITGKARGMNCDFLKGPGPWTQTRDEIFANCLAANGATISPNLNAMVTAMKQCEGNAGGAANAQKVKVLAPNKLYKEPNGEDTAANTICTVNVGDTADLVAKGNDIGLDEHWVKVANVSGGCGGKGGFVWNEGELQLP